MEGLVLKGFQSWKSSTLLLGLSCLSDNRERARPALAKTVSQERQKETSVQGKSGMLTAGNMMSLSHWRSSFRRARPSGGISGFKRHVVFSARSPSAKSSSSGTSLRGAGPRGAETPAALKAVWSCSWPAATAWARRQRDHPAWNIAQKGRADLPSGAAGFPTQLSQETNAGRMQVGPSRVAEAAETPALLEDAAPDRQDVLWLSGSSRGFGSLCRCRGLHAKASLMSQINSRSTK